MLPSRPDVSRFIDARYRAGQRAGGFGGLTPSPAAAQRGSGARGVPVPAQFRCRFGAWPVRCHGRFGARAGSVAGGCGGWRLRWLAVAAAGGCGDWRGFRGWRLQAMLMLPDHRPVPHRIRARGRPAWSTQIGLSTGMIDAGRRVDGPGTSRTERLPGSINRTQRLEPTCPCVARDLTDHDDIGSSLTSDTGPRRRRPARAQGWRGGCAGHQ